MVVVQAGKVLQAASGSKVTDIEPIRVTKCELCVNEVENKNGRKLPTMEVTIGLSPSLLDTQVVTVTLTLSLNAENEVCLDSSARIHFPAGLTHVVPILPEPKKTSPIGDRDAAEGVWRKILNGFWEEIINEKYIMKSSAMCIDRIMQLIETFVTFYIIGEYGRLASSLANVRVRLIPPDGKPEASGITSSEVTTQESQPRPQESKHIFSLNLQVGVWPAVNTATIKFSLVFTYAEGGEKIIRVRYDKIVTDGHMVTKERVETVLVDTFGFNGETQDVVLWNATDAPLQLLTRLAVRFGMFVS